MAELDDRDRPPRGRDVAVRPDRTPVTIAYMESRRRALSVFELLPLVRALRPLVTRSRPLRATDLALTNEARVEQDAAPSVETRAARARARATCGHVRDDLDAFLQPLEALLADLVANRAAIAGRHRRPRRRDRPSCWRAPPASASPQAGWGFAYDFRLRVFAALLAHVPRAGRGAGRHGSQTFDA